MAGRLYSSVRDLHLYVGFLLSPLIIVFSLSVIFLVHAWLPGATGNVTTRRADHIAIPVGLEQLKAREQVDALHRVLDQIGVHGEIGFVRQIPRERRFVVPVSLPGRETTVDLSVGTGAATIRTRETGGWDAMVFLHKMPGPHNVAIRGNAVFIRVWRWLADVAVYGLLFITASGVYLWAVLKAERRVGIAFLLAGAASFVAVIAALVA